MLNPLPKDPKSTKVFGWRWLESQERLFVKERRKIAEKLNQRMLKITFHTFRHWKATVEYHKTKDILRVMQILGHKNINNTLMYTQLVNLNFKEKYVSKVAKTVKEACQLIEAGFEYVCDINETKIFRKRK